MHVIQERVPKGIAASPAPPQPALTVPASAAGQTVLRIDGLTKRFGSITAVDGLSLEVRTGEVVGLLGPNGAGKSTTVGMILGLIKPNAGRIELLGQDAAHRQAVERREVGAIVEQPAFYPYLSGRDNLRAITLAAGLGAERIEYLLALVGLQDRAGSAYKTYSLGMKQRLGIASTLLTNPALVILDEPANGLDPAGQREVRELIPRLAQEGHGVLLASHLLHEVELVCGSVVIIRRGKLISSGAVQELLRRESFLEVDIAEPVRAAEIIQALPFVQRVTVDGDKLSVIAPVDSGAAINRALAQHSLYAATIVPRTSSLEDVFFELTETPADAERSVPNGTSAT